ncbi:hypothetical protein DMR_32570 [Solidesulfovibrio magneticus RS-1]|uniref:Uncharacterized protein n=2 Tax=Solidesulfovibrio TaxID=2910984 RepID=C4XJK1_SOLM1|nr:hypothetical protein DMR_32570 [Solidesulfovibrio magneticus RS-1]
MRGVAASIPAPALWTSLGFAPYGPVLAHSPCGLDCPGPSPPNRKGGPPRPNVRFGRRRYQSPRPPHQLPSPVTRPLPRGYPLLVPGLLDHEVNMPTEAESNDKMLELIEEITKRFQPIEHLFDVMGAADSGVQGVFVRRWAEIGMHLTATFREYLDQIVAVSKGNG